MGVAPFGVLHGYGRSLPGTGARVTPHGTAGPPSPPSEDTAERPGAGARPPGARRYRQSGRR